MIGENDNTIEQIYTKVKHIIDNVYRKKGLTSDEIRRYFLIKKNFRMLLNSMSDLKHIYDENKYEMSFHDRVYDMLFNRVIMDRIYYEKDNPQNESIIKKYNSFIKIGS